MSDAYWAYEYARVALAFIGTFYLWPEVVFGGHLRGRAASYQFAFCVLVPTGLLTTVISFLGLARLISPLPLCVLFYGSFAVCLLRRSNPFKPLPAMARSVARKTMTRRRLLLNVASDFSRWLGRGASHFWHLSRNRRLRYLTLLACLLFGSVYFSWSALQTHCYGFSDQYVHHSWVWQMSNGGIYPRGVYPEGLHCVVYALSALYGIRTYSVILYLGGVYVHAILIAAYLMMRELFTYEFTPLFVLVAFLTVVVPSADGISGMSRLAATLPMEFGFIGAFLAVQGLLRFLKRRPSELPTPWWHAFDPRRLVRDPDLFVFIAGVATTIMIHFYSTIIAFILCVAIAIIYAARVLRPGRFVPLLASVIVALAVSCAPMVTALGLGYKFQGSINWAIAVSRGGEEAWANGEYDPNADYLSTDDEQGEDEPEQEELPQDLVELVRDRLLAHAVEIYDATFEELYKGLPGRALLYLTCVIGVVSVVSCGLRALWHLLCRRVRPPRGGGGWAPGPIFKESSTCEFSGYVCVVSILLTFMVSYDPRPAGLPILIAGARLCALIQLFALMVVFCWPDLVLSLVDRAMPSPLMSTASCAGCVALYVVLQGTGLFHGFTYYEVTRWPAAVDATERIVAHMPRNMYTIVSTTDELYQMIGNGYHEELVDLAGREDDPSYTIPTPYVFVYIEKHPIVYAQRLVATGPLWLASGATYPTLAQYREDIASYPDIMHGSTSSVLSDQRIPRLGRTAEPLEVLAQREVLESHGQAWLERMIALHLNECQTIYEDDDFWCVCIHQNAQSLLTLGVMGDREGV